VALVTMARQTPTRFVRLASQANHLLILLVVVAVGLIWASPDLLHAHRSAGPGLYDAECPLAEIAAHGGQGLVLSSIPAVPAAGLANVVATVVPANFCARLSRPCDSRAPPARLI
jgi:hypothetical protein